MYFGLVADRGRRSPEAAFVGAAGDLSVFAFLLIHIPGASGHLLSDLRLPHRDFTEVGIRCTAIGCWSFVAGLWLARIGRDRQAMIWRHPGWPFLLFCLLGGWAVTFGVRPFLVRIPSIGAAIDKGGMIWVLGILIGLAASWQLETISALDQTYRVTGVDRTRFEWNPNPDAGPMFLVKIDGNVVFEGKFKRIENWTAFELFFVAADTDAVLQIQSQVGQNNDGDYLVDDIAI